MKYNIKYLQWIAHFFLVLFCLVFSFAAYPDSRLPSVKKMTLSVTPWKLTADGYWYAMARMQYYDQNGIEIDIPNATSGFDVTGASVRTLARWEESDRIAVITLDHGSARAPIVKAWSRSPKFPTLIRKLAVPDDDINHLELKVINVGPYANGLGWTPLAKLSPITGYRLYRIQGSNTKLIANLQATQHNYFDADGITPRQKYQYRLDAVMGQKVKSVLSNEITASPLLPKVKMDNFYGRGALVFFRPTAGVEKSYTDYVVQDVIRKAKTAKLDYLEVQLQYGAASKLNSPEVNAWFQQLVKQAHRNNIKILAWVVPRSPSYESESSYVQLMAKSFGGENLDGLVLNIEPGESYMGEKNVQQRILKLLQELRRAMGKDYPLVMMMPLPKAAADFPYAATVPYVNAVEPMIFWHHKIKKGFRYDRQYVFDYCQKSIHQIAKIYGNTPIIMIGQSADLGNTGIPSAREIAWSAQAAKQSKTAGIAYFDWSGMHKDGWLELGQV